MSKEQRTKKHFGTGMERHRTLRLTVDQVDEIKKDMSAFATFRETCSPDFNGHFAVFCDGVFVTSDPDEAVAKARAQDLHPQSALYTGKLHVGK